ncbi:hypothetical protein HID58_052056 [Brassica napus]|uniref:Uncharacterized protein n=1 Tax=Brassica napus TaxID=3708 RepID=A0ABQ8ABG1_BRANA|nr:hypothetical protein HID58_052056 [Brassica napus]
MDTYQKMRMVSFAKAWPGVRTARERPVWRKDAVGLGAGVSNLVRRSVVLIPGHGSYPSSVVAGPSPGGGGFLRSTDSGFSSREEETYAAPSSPALDSKGGGFQSYALSVMRPIILWVVATSLWRVVALWFLVVRFQWLAVSFWRMRSRRVR